MLGSNAATIVVAEPSETVFQFNAGIRHDVSVLVHPFHVFCQPPRASEKKLALQGVFPPERRVQIGLNSPAALSFVQAKVTARCSFVILLGYTLYEKTSLGFQLFS
jgi:hypothetical protein